MAVQSKLRLRRRSAYHYPDFPHAEGLACGHVACVSEHGLSVCVSLLFFGVLVPASPVPEVPGLGFPIACHLFCSRATHVVA